MKKLHLFLSALLLMASAFTCFAQTDKQKQQAQPPAQTEKRTPQTTPHPDKAVPAIQGLQDATLIANERQLWDALKGKDSAAFSGFVAEDAWIVDETGMVSRAAFVQTMPEFSVTEYTFTDPKVVWLNKDVALLTYRTGLRGSFRGQEFPPAPAQHTTIWVNRNGKWTAVFHQMTPTRSQ